MPEGPLYVELQAVLQGGSLAGNAQLQQDDTGAWAIQGDPTEAAFLVAEHKLSKLGKRETGEPASDWKEHFERIGEIPFTSQRKMMSVFGVDHADDDAYMLFAKGAPDVLLAYCTHARRGEATVVLDAALRAQVLADVAAMTGDALLTLNLGYGGEAGEDVLIETAQRVSDQHVGRLQAGSSELGAQFGGNGAGIARCLAGRIAGVARPIVGKNRLPACQFLHHAPHTALPSPNPDCNTMVGEWPSSLTQVSSVRSRRPRRSLPEAAGAVAQPARCATARRGGVFSDQ